MIGGISVSVTTGLGAAIVTTAMGDNQVRSDIRIAVRMHCSLETLVSPLVHLLLIDLCRCHSQ